MIASEKRLCFECGEPGHTARRCPKKQNGAGKLQGGGRAAGGRGGSVRVVEPEGEDFPCFGFGCVEHGPGFTRVKRGAKPRPQGAALGDYFPDSSRNTFALLGAVEHNIIEHDPTEHKGDMLAVRDLENIVPDSKIFKKLFPDISETFSKKVSSKVVPKMNSMNSPKISAKVPAKILKANLMSSPKVSTKVPESVLKEIAKVTRAAPSIETEVPVLPPSSEAEVPELAVENQQIGVLDWAERIDEILAVPEPPKTVRVKAAIDSGAVEPVINPKQLPEDVSMHKGPEDHDFVDASGGSIKNHGKCLTKLTDGQGRQVLTQWRGAEVTRALHSASDVTGRLG